MDPIRVGAEETIAEYGDFNNGAGPMWGFGSRTIVREGRGVYALVPEMGQGVKPLCNTRWCLYRRPDGGVWARVAEGAAFNEREPCLLARLPGGRLAVSTNPAVRVRDMMPDGREACDTRPEVLLFDSGSARPLPGGFLPAWDAAYHFTEHSYRAFVADPETGAVMLTNQVAVGREYLHAWSFYDGELRPVKQGLLRFPMRGCYQQLAVRGTAVAVMAISDEVEPNAEWREHKRKVTGSEWDYDFRQLYFTWTPDIGREPFSPIATIASRDETCGYISNLDLRLDADGTAHLLYLDRNIWHRFMRDRFFPATPMTVALKYARVNAGRVLARQTIAEAVEDGAAGPAQAAGKGSPGPRMAGTVAAYATFHRAADGRLLIIWSWSGEGASSLAVQPVRPEEGPAVTVPLAVPFRSFNGACERNGCLPSNTVDLYGIAEGKNEIRYVRLDLLERRHAVTP